MHLIYNVLRWTSSEPAELAPPRRARAKEPEPPIGVVGSCLAVAAGTPPAT